MKIAICGSMTFSKEMLGIKELLEAKGHTVIVPHGSHEFASQEFGPESGAEATSRKIAGNLMQKYYWEIKEAEAVLIANYEKNGVKGYIGGNSFLEAGFANVLDKKLYFVNDIPEMTYSDELRAMQPIILHNNVNLIQ